MGHSTDNNNDGKASGSGSHLLTVQASLRWHRPAAMVSEPPIARTSSVLEPPKLLRYSNPYFLAIYKVASSFA
jgi:hypothetical protein